jgi:hypothetical protein
MNPAAVADFLEFTADDDGEADVVAEVVRHGSVAAQPFQARHRVEHAMHSVEWSAVGEYAPQPYWERRARVRETPQLRIVQRRWRTPQVLDMTFFRKPVKREPSPPAFRYCVICGWPSTIDKLGQTYCDMHGKIAFIREATWA